VRLVVPADHAAGRVWADASVGAAADVDDGHRLRPLVVGGADPSRCSEDLFAGWWQLISALGSVPRVLVWDGEGANGPWRGGRVELAAECQAFRGTLGARVLVCKPADPKLRA
jgi:hypothetical protein